MRKFTLLAFLLMLSVVTYSQTNNLPTIELTPFSTGFSQPVGIEHAGDSRLFVVEQTGKIRIVDTNGKHKSHFLNLSDKIFTGGFEQGLLGLAFHPEYADNGYFYVHYTNLDGNSTISRFSVNRNNPSKALPSSEVIMFVNDDPFGNHNGGQMKFGQDGYLYFTIGDGGSGGDPLNNAQNTSTTYGKLLRIDPTADGGYDIPADNPYADVEGAAPEIWATGLRNPWRFSFDLLTGDLWIPDVGQNAYEEINYTPAGTAGVNYGWSCMEGNHFFKADCDANETPFTGPVSEYEHSTDTSFLCSGSITGGYIYRGGEYPDMYGKYFYTDFCTGVIRTTWWDGTDWVSTELGNYTPFAYSTFGEDISGELYLADKTAGIIYRFTDGGGGAFTIATQDFDTDVNSFLPSPVRNIDPDVDVDEYIIETIYRTPRIIGVVDVRPAEYRLSPNPNHGQFTLHFDAEKNAEANVIISDAVGRIVRQEKRSFTEGVNTWEFNTPDYGSGLYFVQIRTNDHTSIVSFVVE